MTITLHATPYGYYENFAGFYFESAEDYAEKYAAAFKSCGCEEYEIQFIDGPGIACELAAAMKLGQNNLDVFFDLVGSDTANLVVYIWLVKDRGWNSSDAIDRIDDVCLFGGSVKEYTYEFVDDCIFTPDTPEVLKMYFDYDAFARDLELGGDVDTIEVDGTRYVIINANEF